MATVEVEWTVLWSAVQCRAGLGRWGDDGIGTLGVEQWKES
jgi:hypothetical protein